MNKLTSVLLILLLVLSTSIFAQPSPSVVAEQTPYGSYYYNHGSHVARTSDGKLFAMWSDLWGEQVVYSQYDPGFQLWSAPVAISTNPSGGTANDAAIAADDAGNLYCVWNQKNASGDNYMIWLAKYDGNAWGTPVNLTVDTLENEEPNVTVANDGKVFVVWNTDEEDLGNEWILCVNSSDGGATWSSVPDTLSSADGIIGDGSIECARVNLARGSGGKMVATWFEFGDVSVTEEIYAAQYDGLQWADEMFVTADTLTIKNRYPWAALDNADNIILVYRGRHESKYGIEMKQKAWSDVAWPETSDNVVPEEHNCFRPSIVIDADNNLFVAYERDIPTVSGLDEIALVASSDGGTTWTNQLTLSRPYHDCGYVSMDQRVTSSGIDLLWAEGADTMNAVGSGDTIAIVYGHVDLSVAGLEFTEPQVADEFSLSQNYPNPFNPSTEIKFQIKSAGEVQLVVYNTLGQEIATLVNNKLTSGSYKVDFDASKLGSGVYFYKLSVNGFVATKKMILVK